MTKIYKQHPVYTKIEISECGHVRYVNGKDKGLYTDKAGYLVFSLKSTVDGKRKVTRCKVHRLVAELYLDPPSQELTDFCSNTHWGVVCVKHKDNDKTNNHYTNLMYDSMQNNTSDAWRDGLIPIPKGVLNGRAILSEETVHQMCRDFENGDMPLDVVRRYGVSRQQATKIRAGFAWVHISCQYDIKVNRRKK